MKALEGDAEQGDAVVALMERSIRMFRAARSWKAVSDVDRRRVQYYGAGDGGDGAGGAGPFEGE